MDAKGQQGSYFLQYLHDSYGRVTTVQSVPGTPVNPSTPVTVLRTYTYDTNSIDTTYSQNASGRLTTIQYNVSGTWYAPYTDYVTQAQVTFTGDNVVEMYSYNKPGQVNGSVPPLHVVIDPTTNHAGAQNPSNKAGEWNGTAIPCARDRDPIPVNSKNACFSPTMTWGRQGPSTVVPGTVHSSVVVHDGFEYTISMQGQPEFYPPIILPLFGIPYFGNLIATNTPGDIMNAQVPYNPAGPNSHSLASWIFQQGSVYISSPPGAIGWGSPLP